MSEKENSVIRLTTPLTEAEARTLQVGDQVLLSGILYTARDAAHKKMVEALQRGEQLPIDIKDQIIYYVGPTPARPGRVIGSALPPAAVWMRMLLSCLLWD